MDASLEKMKQYAPLFLRLSLAVVFLLFGFQKLMFPGQGTAEIQQIFTTESGTMSLGIASALNYYMGLFEAMLGIALALGMFIRRLAPLAALAVLGIFVAILFTYGLNTEDETLLFDVGLVGAGLALWFLGAGSLSFDNRNQENINQGKLAAYAPLVIRVGLAFSLLLSGYQKIVGDVAYLGWIELILALLLFGGLLIRFTAPAFVLLAVWSLWNSISEHGFYIGDSILPDPALSRTIGVLGAGLALWFLGAGMMSIDMWYKKRSSIPEASSQQP